MNSRRRRANDFTNSLISFRQTFMEDQSQAMCQTYSEDSLETASVRSKQQENDNRQNHPKDKTRTGSIILAGHLATEHNMSLPDSYESEPKGRQAKDINVLDETSYLSIKPDLNKCINLFRNECLSKENNTSEELAGCSTSEIRISRNMDILCLKKNKTVEVQCDLSRDYQRSASLSSLRNTDCSCNSGIRRSKSCITVNDNNLKRTSNTGIKVDLFSLTNRDTSAKGNTLRKVQIIVAPYETVVSESCTLPDKNTDSHSVKDDQKRDSVSSERSSKEELNPSELRTLLNSLGNQKPPKKEEEETVPKRLLRRMSASFYDSPKNFTERLLTIIEESFVNNDTCAPLEFPEVSLCRLTEELRKMCRFIEDETVPEWPRSPNPSMSSARKNSKGHQESKLDSSRRSLRPVTTPDKVLCAATQLTPTRHNIKSPKKGFHRHMPKISAQSPKPHDSTSTFESLEAFCKILYPNEYGTPQETKNWSESPIRDMKHILLTCGDQMASLENSPNICKQLRKAETITVECPAHKQPDTVTPETRDLQYRLLSQPENSDKIGRRSISNLLKHKAQAGSSKYNEMIDPDDLENTLMYELAKKRQRCLDTAKVILEIESNSEVSSTVAAEAQQEQQQSCNMIESSNINDSKFMETLMTVKKYQNYLEEYKPLLNLLQRTETSNASASDSDAVNVRVKKVAKARLEAPRFPTTTRKTSTSPSVKYSSARKPVTSKPKLFVTPGKTPVRRAGNSKRTYFPNLITGTGKQKGRDISPHERNVYRQMGNYDHVISPVGMYIRSTNPPLMKNLRPKTDEMLLTPRRKQTTSSGSSKPRMKFRLSPKEPAEEAIETPVDENVADNFIHPKVHYKLPSHVRTIKEGRKVGNRINELLRTTQDKVVIRHEDRAKTIKTDCLKQPEIHYTSAEESVHIEQTACKTNFSRT